MATLTKNSKKKTTPTIVTVGANEIGKLPPQALDFEESVLGALMIEKEAYGIVADLLRPESFYAAKHRYIYEAIRTLSNNDNPIDVLSVAQQLKTMGLLEEAGGVVFLSDLTRRVASAAHLRYHAQIVAQKATARDLITVACQIEEKGYDETQDVDELIQEAEGRIFEISQRSQKREVTSIDPVITEAFARMRAASQNDGNISGIPSGFTELDKITSGWQKSDLVIIAARPAMGKTAFAVNLATNIAQSTPKTVALFNMEMGAEQLAMRMISAEGEVDQGKLKRGELDDNDFKKINEAVVRLGETNLVIDDTSGMTIGEIKAKCRRLASQENGLAIVIIDYLTLIQGSAKYQGNRQQEVSEISRSLKTMAMDLEVPVIALAQLSRSVEQRDDKRPMLSDLRESGSIEQDADIVAFLYRDDYYMLKKGEEETSDISQSEFIVAKHRSGPTDTINLLIKRNISKFVDIVNKDMENG